MPPHVQAKKCYETHLEEVGGAKLLVTMEEPTTEKPEPIIFEIGKDGIKLRGGGGSAKTASVATSIITTRTPRAGK
jgi:hypothetical protein